METKPTGWEPWAAWYERELAPMSERVIAMAGVAPGQRVLDVACGIGQPAIPAARRVGSGGRVVGVDVAAEQLAIARRRAVAAGVDNVEWLERSGQALGLADADFDAVTCAQALMFFPDPVRGVAEIRRVLRPGGRAAFVVWGERATNPFFTTFFDALHRFVPAPAPDPKAPGQFRLGPPGELEAVLGAGGLTDVIVERHPITFTLDTPADYWQLFLDIAPPVRAAVASLGDRAGELRDAVLAAAAPYLDAGRLRLPASPIYASGRA
jgi:SAM-dependent methyltransferase